MAAVATPVAAEQKEIKALKKLAFALDKKRTSIEQELMALIEVVLTLYATCTEMH